MASGFSAPRRFPEALLAHKPGRAARLDHESLRDASDRGIADGDGRNFSRCSGEESGTAKPCFSSLAPADNRPSTPSPLFLIRPHARRLFTRCRQRRR